MKLIFQRLHAFFSFNLFLFSGHWKSFAMKQFSGTTALQTENHTVLEAKEKIQA